MDQKHPIAVVSMRTGLSPHVIRAWEKRYGAVKPERTPGNHRLYSDDDVKRLLLLRRGIDAGRSIGQLARLPTDELLKLIDEDMKSSATERRKEIVEGGASAADSRVEASMQAVRNFDSTALRETLDRSSVALGTMAVIEDIIVPLMVQIGEQWSRGAIRILHEHMAAAVIRTYLGDVLRSLEVSDAAPRAIASTLEGERHELGALAAAVSAALEGWKAEYAGSNLPWEEIAGAAELYDARAVLISVIMPDEMVRVGADLRRLRTYLPERVQLLVGGSMASSFRKRLNHVGIVFLNTLPELRMKLKSLRLEQ
jgi:DNA-binding transcriptional MerR regulator/methylmalonyl-CoA mutase cobalamin-binding subunit